MTTVQELIETARSFIGTPFHHQGRQPGIGLDCAGLVVCAHRQCGLKIHSDMKEYGRIPKPSEMRNALGGTGLYINPSNKLPGDVLWFRVQGEPRHLAINTGETIIHSYYHAGEVVEHTFSEEWQNGLMAVYRHPRLVYE